MKKQYILLALAVSALLIYSSSLTASFHFDDFLSIIENKDVAVTDLKPASLERAAFTKGSGLRPVSHLLFALNYYFSGNNPVSYRIINILIHVLNAFLIYLIILRLFLSDESDDEDRKRISMSAFFTSLIWLVSPLNSQAVIYIVQRMTLLMSFFFLLAFYMYLIGREKKSVKHFILCGVFFVLSLLSKQNGVVFPLVIVVYELTMRRSEKGISSLQKGMFASMAVLMAGLILAYKGNIYESILKGYSIRDFTMYERLLTQSRVIVFYLSLLLMPLPSRLNLSHDIIKSTSPFSPVTTLFSLVFIAALFSVSIIRMKKSPYLSFALLWFFVTMSVESTILPLEQIFEHRMYLPSIFLIGFIVDFITLNLHKNNKRALLSTFISISLVFGVMTGIRGLAWKNAVTLWSDVLKKSPDNPRAYYNIGYDYYKKGDYKNTLKYFQKSLEAEPGNARVLYAIGNIYDANLKKYDEAEKYYKLAIKNANTGSDFHINSLNNLGSLYSNTNRLKEAFDAFSELISISPENGQTHYNIGLIYVKKNDHISAADEFCLAIEYGFLTPNAFEAAIITLVNLGDMERTMAIYEKHKDIIDGLCVNHYLKYGIFKSRNDLTSANRYNGLYKNCKRGF